MLTDPHDPRTFRHYAKVDAHGNILAIVEVAAGSPAPDDVAYTDVTDQALAVRTNRPAPKVDEMT